MRYFPALGLLLVLLVPGQAPGAGFAHNGNFIVLAPDQALAEQLLERAEVYRKQAAEEWLGEELPPSVGPVCICYQPSEKEDKGLTWPVDYPGRKYHKVWLTTSLNRAMSTTLHHEMVHCVIFTQYGDAVPAWCVEGAASMADDEARAQTRQRVLAWFAKTGNWPALSEVLDAPTILSDDQKAYSVAASLTEYLLTRGDRPTLLRFAVAGKKHGWDRALKEHYQIASVDELQRAWQAFVGGARPGSVAGQPRSRWQP